MHDTLALRQPVTTPDPSRACCSAVDLMRLLSNPLRLHLVAALSGSPRCGSDLVAELGWSFSQISESLHAFLDSGLASVRQQKKYRYYSLSDAVSVIREDEILCIAVTCDNGDRIVVQIASCVGTSGLFRVCGA